MLAGVPCGRATTGGAGPPGQTGGGCGCGTRAWPGELVVDEAAALLMIGEMGTKASDVPSPSRPAGRSEG